MSDRSPMTTLCYLERDGSYLMLHRIKKEHDVNRDKWIGIGGHFEGTESPEECLLRECREETGLTLTSYQYRGLITFVYDGKAEYMSLFARSFLHLHIHNAEDSFLPSKMASRSFPSTS